MKPVHHSGGGAPGGGLFRAGALRSAALGLALACASPLPDAIAYGADSCAYCRMLIADERFAAMAVTFKGRTIKFDSIECLLAYLHQGDTAHTVASVWVSNFRSPGAMLDASRARFADLGAGHAPMGRGWVAVASARDAAALGVIDAGAIKQWADLQ
ncbi:MAG: nitrous oxide reductase accessory protein NosL [Gemmatimonadales bacterium]